MSVNALIRCDFERCTESLELATEAGAAWARLRASKETNGWSHDGVDDFCPLHTAAQQDQHGDLTAGTSPAPNPA